MKAAGVVWPRVPTGISTTFARRQRKTLKEIISLQDMICLSWVTFTRMEKKGCPKSWVKEKCKIASEILWFLLTLIIILSSTFHTPFNHRAQSRLAIYREEHNKTFKPIMFKHFLKYISIPLQHSFLRTIPNTPIRRWPRLPDGKMYNLGSRPQKFPDCGEPPIQHQIQVVCMW